MPWKQGEIRMTRWWTQIAAGCLIAAAVILCVEPAEAQTLRIGLAEDPDLLDPTLARSFVGRIVFASLCDKLFDIGPELDIVPQLATEWRWTDGNTGLVIKLRPGVKFHDGEPLDAAAVKFSIERHLTMPGSNRKGEISAVTGVDIIDDHTVKLVLSAPFAPLLAQLTDRAGMVMSPTAAQAAGENFGAHPVCAGPFKFVERVAQDRIVLERFGDYWDKAQIKLDRIVYLPIPDSTVRLANLRSGGLDMIERVAATDLDTARKDPHLKIVAITGLGYNGITINLDNGERSKTPLGQDARVPHALELSIDREALNQVVFNGEFQSGNQWVPPSSPYYVKALPIPSRDTDKAKALLTAASTPNPIVPMMVPNTPELLQAAQVIQAWPMKPALTSGFRRLSSRPLCSYPKEGISRLLSSVGVGAPIPTATSITLCPVRLHPRSMSRAIATRMWTTSWMSRGRLQRRKKGSPTMSMSPSKPEKICRSYISITTNGCGRSATS
jgi:peptide/nickel transport system substrate-binding protein